METKMRGAHLPAKNVTYDVETNQRGAREVRHEMPGM